MNPKLLELEPYPFEKLAALKAGAQPPANLTHINMSIGEPQHEFPAFIADVIAKNLSGLSKYPLTTGSIELRQSIAAWISRRFKVPTASIDPEKNVLPVNGTREALFSFAQAVVNTDVKEKPLVLFPNPFYQIYEGAAILAGAEPYYINCREEMNWNPDFDSVPASAWDRCQLLYLCSPGNPTGAVLSRKTLHKLVQLAHKHDFIIASDECYSEIYFDDNAAPPGLLEIATPSGNAFERCVVFHSLSKRSSLPGMRSGFVAGDAAILNKYRLFRTYHGCAMSPTYQAASTAAWNDEEHVVKNRELYRQKFDAVLQILGPVMHVQKPDAGFYLWPQTAIDGQSVSDEVFTRKLFEQCNVTVLPGSYLGRVKDGINPGAGHVRMALVASVEETVDAAHRMNALVTRSTPVPKG